MAAVEHPATSMNGNINFTIGQHDDNDDAFEAATLQDEVNIFQLAIFHLFLLLLTYEKHLSNIDVYLLSKPKCLSLKLQKSP